VLYFFFTYYQLETRCQELPPGPSGAHAEDHCDLEQWLPCVPTPTRQKKQKRKFNYQLQLVCIDYKTTKLLDNTSSKMRVKNQ